MRQTFGIRNSKSRIMCIQVFYVLKAYNIPFKFSYKHAFAGKRIRHDILFSFDVLDDIGKKSVNSFDLA